MTDEHTRDDAERLADRIIAAFDDNGFELADGWIERARMDAITILKDDIDARDAALRNARAAGPAAERASIVDWLRKQVVSLSAQGNEMAAALCSINADAIERCGHAQPEPEKSE